jgi:hypothetical protein
METLLQIGLVAGLGVAVASAAGRQGGPRVDALHVALAAWVAYAAYVAHRRGRLLLRVENEVLLPLLAECELSGRVPPGTYYRATGRQLPQGCYC